MSSADRARHVEAALDRTRRAQRAASDPAASVWVGANAGTGKTHVLTRRVLRLMLAGTPPERILCLTYTKAAAAEMSQRVFDQLAGWVTRDAAALAETLAELIDRTPTPDETQLARTLFARAIETPGGLKVQTIHAFCERLLKRFPLEAGVPPGFKILDDHEARTILREATERTLGEATRDRTGPLGRALTTAIAHAADDRFEELIAAALAKRDWLAAAAQLDDASGEAEADGYHRAAGLMLRAALGVDKGATAAAIASEQAGVLSDDMIARAAAALAEGGATDRELAAGLAAAVSAHGETARVAALRGVLLTAKGEPRSDKRFVTKKVQLEEPGAYAALVSARDRFAALDAEAAALAAIEATVALLALADRTQQHVEAAKRRRAALDFEDLIRRTASLLSTADSADWVLYKLDGGLDHILVDESQDTAPTQWRVVEALAREFFSGSGAREGALRTVFAVGDEKQSIYSFQGAEPAMFQAMGRTFAGLAADAGAVWRTVPLDLSFRSVAPVLEAVDRTFLDPARTPGVGSGAAPVVHIARRFDKAGLVEIWPSEPYADPPEADAFDPLSETPVRSAVSRLAHRIAARIDGWLQSGERLASTGQPIQPGDILVLVRKRQPFAAPMVAALKARSIPVAGADRIELVEQIAVQDLMALGDFLTLPEDDLSLAAVLKSPLFGLSDDDLFQIAHGRRGALWSALLAHAKENPRLAHPAETLKRWRARADFVPPYEFYAGLLDRDGMRERLLTRLGAEAADPIDAFVDLALRYDDAAPASMSGFLGWLRDGTREVKRDMEHGRNEVRVMTVHGAKGLEAPIVFLPDTCTTATAGGGRTLVELTETRRPPSVPAPWLWAVKGSARIEVVASARVAIAASETEERNRLLYVAMTRARDRLYVAGFERAKGRAAGCWYDLVSAALEGRTATVDVAGEGVVQRLEAQQSGPTEPPRRDVLPELAPVARPDFALRPAAREPQLAVPLAPSSLAPFESDASGEPQEPMPRDRAADEPPPPAPALASDELRFLRGSLTHALLEHLPSFAPPQREAAAAAFVARRGAALSKRARAGIVREAMAILSDAAFAPIFGPASRAEVPIVAEIPRPVGRGPAMRLNGQIDRLAVLEASVLVVDYKTNRVPPRKIEDVPAAYIFQMAAYRLALERIFPEKAVRAALLWTDGPVLMPVPDAMLDDYGQRLWSLDPNRLDG